jgi:hypothetical protein
MWRRKARLADWLYDKNSAGQAEIPWLVRVLRGPLSSLLLRTRVQCPPISIEAAVREFVGIWTRSIAVLDGLGAVGPAPKICFADREIPAQESQPAKLEVREVHPLRPAKTFKSNTTFPAKLPVREQELMILPNIFSKLPQFPGRPLKSYAVSLLNRLPAVRGAVPPLVSPDSGVKSAVEKFSRFPHIRRSVEANEISRREVDEFLNEAEVLKGIKRENAELMAIFRFVPVEIVSKIRFIENKRTILFTLRSDTKPQRTRVHDLAVVRDRSTTLSHFVPHRTKFRSVMLS